MAENKGYYDINETGSSIRISKEVIARVAASACLEAEGVAAMAVVPSSVVKGIVITAEDNKGCAIDAHILLRPDAMVSDVAEAVQGAVKSAVEGLSNVQVNCVNVYVAGIAVK